MTSLERPIFYKNSQWVVTEHGLETVGVDDNYDLQHWRINPLEFMHVAEKSWVNIEEFIKAFERAVGFFEIDLGVTVEEWEQMKSIARIDHKYAAEKETLKAQGLLPELSFGEEMERYFSYLSDAVGE